MKLTEDDLVLQLMTFKQLPKEYADKLVKQIRDWQKFYDEWYLQTAHTIHEEEYQELKEKARILDRLELEPADLPAYVDQCKKLRELLEKRIVLLEYLIEKKEGQNEPHKWVSDMIDVLQKLLEDCKK